MVFTRYTNNTILKKKIYKKGYKNNMPESELSLREIGNKYINITKNIYNLYIKNIFKMIE